jgi:uncharacterized membrane protein
MSVGDWFEVVAARRRLAQWQAAGALAPERAAEARTVLGVDAAPPWRGFLDALALWLGAALLGAGVIFFIAANWEQLGKFARLIGMQVLLVAAAAAAIRFAQRRVAGEAALLLAVLLLGALLALLGQTYQTGADTWQLFALWAALALPWAVAARSAVVWLLWVMLVNVALALWLDLQPWRLFRALTGVAVVGIVNTVLLLVWETAARRLPEFAERIAPRLIAALAIAALTFGAAAGAIERRVFLFDLLPWLIVTAFLIRRYWIDRRDVVVLAMAALGVIVVATTLLGRLLLDGRGDMAFSLLVLAVAVVGQSTAAAVWLRRLAREGNA